jgi:arginase
MQNQFIATPFILDQPAPELETLAQSGWHINRHSLPPGDIQHRLSVLHQPLADFVANTITHGDRPISIAGDCCTPIGVAAGLRRAGLDPVLIWLDAHGDFNTWQTTRSGFVGGMPLAMLVGRGEQAMLEAVGLQPLSEDHVILTDARDLDPEEKQTLAGSRVIHVMDSRALLQQPLLARPLYVHFDTDLINPDDAPAMRYRTPGGPSAADLKTLFRALAQTGQVIAVSMATWDPDLDKDGRTRTICMELLHALIDD